MLFQKKGSMLNRASINKMRAHLARVAWVCDDPTVQVLLPQVVGERAHYHPQSALALDSRAPAECAAHSQGRRVEHDLHIFAKNLGVGGRNAQCRQRDVAGYRRQLLKDALLAAVLRLTAQTVEDLGGIQNIHN